MPARILCEEGLWLVIRNGEPTGAYAMPDPWEVPDMEWVAFSPMITEEEYDAMLANPLDIDPKQPVDVRRLKPRF